MLYIHSLAFGNFQFLKTAVTLILIPMNETKNRVLRQALLSLLFGLLAKRMAVVTVTIRTFISEGLALVF